MSSDAQKKLTSRSVVIAVDRCVQICIARSEACTAAADEVSDQRLRELLLDFAEKRRLEAVALRGIVEPPGRTSGSGTRARYPSMPQVRTDRDVLDLCTLGETASLVDLESTFTWAPLLAMPMEVRALMLSAHGTTLRVLAELRRFTLG